jgi:hypothetical protein
MSSGIINENTSQERTPPMAVDNLIDFVIMR